ncbi:MAG: hypothetical protein JWN66_167 [Sphingomonas bacterium]|uniref:hypothetical protein n=1 Tax=Sphingomonas bacterium TaxID=1895847 RepID=UPI00261A0A15|nr:hypothetical protein [Sphingomonas bacterium]MDB5703051.1 hypothetical protein [Sphingomonas bacterium]
MIARIMAAALALAATGAAAAQTVGPVLPGVRPSKPEGPAEVSRNAPINGVLTLFGNERCPTDASGAEVVVCVRSSAAEQFRIPKGLRDFKITPENQAWAVKAQGLVNDPTVGGGVGSCSTVGPGGQSGCFLKQAEASRRENKDKKEDQQKLEDSLP